MPRTNHAWTTDAVGNGLKPSPMLSAIEEHDLARRAQHGDRQAVEALTRAHLRLVKKIARQSGQGSLSHEDLISEGLLGLLEATHRFDPERGVRFAAYAGFWIRAYVQRYIAANRRMVRPPSTRNGRMLLANLRKTQRALAQRDGCPPSTLAVADALGVSVQEIDEVEAALSGWDLPCGQDVSAKELELAAKGPSPEALVVAADERQRSNRSVRRALHQLSARERRIVEQRYLRAPNRSLAAIGQDLGISRERVRQLQLQAQDKLRDVMGTSAAKAS